MPVQEMPAAVREAAPARKRAVPTPPARKTRPKTWILAAGLILLVAAGLIWRAVDKPAPIAWGSAQVHRGTVTKTVSATGRVDALTTVNVGSQASGTISEIYVDYNSPVKKDQIIARLDPRSYRRSLPRRRRIN